MVPTAARSPIVARTVLSVANYNMHCGMNGWGTPYDYLGSIAALDADVIVLEEAWTTEGDERGGQAAEAARHLGYQHVSHAIGEGRRIRPQPGEHDTWIAQPSWADTNRALYMDGQRPLKPEVRTLERWQDAEPGAMNIAVLVRPELPIEGTRLLPLRVLRYDRVRRAALVVDLTVDGIPMSVAGTHMSHLIYGSPHNFLELRRKLLTEARPDAVLAGDMNAWGPLVSLFLRGWRRAIRGRTWPAWSPHSQIDHILVRGSLRPLGGRVLPHSGSDHRPVRVELAVGEAARRSRTP
jgi:endonuclease/exonuclease/phosphatase family metal-dependent hydrolase